MKHLAEGRGFVAYSLEGYSPAWWGKGMVAAAGGILVTLQPQSESKEQAENRTQISNFKTQPAMAAFLQ